MRINYCPSCGEGLPEQAQFCPRCGKKIAESAQNKHVENEAEKNERQAETQNQDIQNNQERGINSRNLQQYPPDDNENSRQRTGQKRRRGAKPKQSNNLRIILIGAAFLLTVGGFLANAASDGGSELGIAGLIVGILMLLYFAFGG